MRSFPWLRCVALLGLLAAAAAGQYPFPAALRQFLALNDEQVAAIGARNGVVAAAQRENDVRQAGINGRIAAETARSTPDPAELGRLYVDLETTRRERAALARDAVPDQQAVLTAEQRARLDALAQAFANNQAACQATEWILLPPGASPIFVRDPYPANRWFDSSNFAPAYVPCPGSGAPAPAPPEPLRSYLGLTSEQSAAIGQVHSEFSQYSTAQTALLVELNRQIQETTASASPDALAIGALQQRRREAERALAARRAAALAANLDKLSMTQRLQLEDLTVALGVFPTACAAVDQHLLNEPTRELRAGDFSYGALGPQAGPGPAPGFCRQP